MLFRNLMDLKNNVERLWKSGVRDAQVMFRRQAGANALDLLCVAEAIQHDVCARAGESARDAEADTTGGTGDNSGLAGKLFVHVCSLVVCAQHFHVRNPVFHIHIGNGPESEIEIELLQTLLCTDPIRVARIELLVASQCLSH